MNAKHMFSIMMIILFSIYFPTKIEQSSIRRSHFYSKQYDEMLVNSTSDATRKLFEVTDSYSNEIISEGAKIDYRNVNLNLDAALDRFYKTLFINLNIENSYAAQQSIKYRIPIKIAVGYEGIYVNYFRNDGSGERWSDIHKFSDVQGDLVIHFTLGEDVTVTNSVTKEEFSGKRKDLQSKYPNSCLKDEETFNSVKSQVINSLIQSELEYYTKYSNEIAMQNGWEMNFNVPYWGNRSVKNIAFIAFYQGESFIGERELHESYGYATSELIDRKDIYGYTLDNKKFYSDKKLSNVKDLTYFESKYEAAINGYEPDPRYYHKGLTN